jgi:hypothetical protein
VFVTTHCSGKAFLVHCEQANVLLIIQSKPMIVAPSTQCTIPRHLPRYATVMFSTGPMFVTIQYALYAHKERLAVLPTALYGSRCFKHIQGSSWHGSDGKLITWIATHTSLAIGTFVCRSRRPCLFAASYCALLSGTSVLIQLLIKELIHAVSVPSPMLILTRIASVCSPVM